MTENDKKLADLALQQGLLSKAQLDECLQELKEIGHGGMMSVPLAEIFIAHEYLTREQIEALEGGGVAEATPLPAPPPPPAPKKKPAAASPPPPPPPEPEPEPEPAHAPAPRHEPQMNPAASESVSLRHAPPEVMKAAEDPMNRIGNYVRVTLLSRGSVGQVWKSWDIPARRWAVVKLLKDNSRSPETMNLLEEAKRTARVDHPNIAKVFDAATVGSTKFDTQHYIAMELVEGKTLEELQAEGMDLKRAAEIMRDSARAVDAAHAENLLHRDIKPRNIMINAHGEVRVMDFGLAKLVELDAAASAELSRTGRIIGTPGYMSPEQAVGRVHDFSARSDVYALGATLYFLMTGKPPYEGKSHFEICFKVVREDLVPPSQVNPQATGDIERIVLRAMAKDPVRRYDSARAMADDLDRYFHGTPIVSDDELRFSQGIAALGAGRLEEAVHMFRELMLLESGRGAMGTVVAGRDAVIAKLNDGEAGMNAAIEQQKNNYNIRNQRGLIRFARAIINSFERQDPAEDCKKALGDVAMACELTPEASNVRVNRANILLFSGRFARDKGKDIMPIFKMALDDLTHALKYDETSSAAFHNRGIVRFYMGMEIAKAKGDPKEHFFPAIDDFTVAAKLEPTYAYVFKDLGVVKVALAKFLLSRGERPRELLEQAVDHLTRAVKLQSRLQGAYFERGMAYFALKRFEEAITDWMRCIDLDPSKRKQVEPYLAEARAKLTAKRATS